MTKSSDEQVISERFLEVPPRTGCHIGRAISQLRITFDREKALWIFNHEK
jgi:hypothetical protein